MADLSVTDVCKEFPSANDQPLSVLRNVSLELSRGENLAIVGDSGCGKSTLLHIMGGLDEPTSGTVQLGEADPFVLSEPELAAFRNHNIGFVFQDHHLLPQLTVLENVLMPALAEGRPSDEIIARAKSLIDRVGLAKRSDNRATMISGGERGRAAVARALIMQPQLLLADEPTGNLDENNAEMISDLLIQLQEQEQAMLVVVTHSQKIAEKLQRRSRLSDGALE